jgi:hypothetical protein
VYWSGPDQAGVRWPVQAHRGSGEAGEGRAARLILTDAAGHRVGFLSQPSGHLYIEGPYEAERAELADAVRGLGHAVTGPSAPALALMSPAESGIEPGWRLWPGSHDRVHVRDCAGPDAATNAPSEEEDWEPQPVDAEGRLLDPVTHEVLPPADRAVYYPGLAALDVPYEGWWDGALALLRRAGLVALAQEPERYTGGCRAGLPALARWHPGVVSTPVAYEDDDPDDEGSPDPFHPDYVAAAEQDVRAACHDLVTGAWDRLLISDPDEAFSQGVTVTAMAAPPPGAARRPAVTAYLVAGDVPRAAPAALPAGWRRPRSGEADRDDVLAVAELDGSLASPATADRLVALVTGALDWPPAARPPLIRTDLVPGPRTPAADIERAEGRDDEQSERRYAYQRAVEAAALQRWADEHGHLPAAEPETDDFDGGLRAALNEAARDYLAPTREEAVTGVLDEWPNDLPSLLLAMATIPDWDAEVEVLGNGLLSFGTDFLLEGEWDRDGVGDDLDELDDAERGQVDEAYVMVPLCGRAFARAWLGGEGDRAAGPLEEIVRVESDRSPEALQAAHALLHLALLRRDVEGVLRWGAAAIRGTGYRTLERYLGEEIDALALAGEAAFAAELAEGARTVTPRRWAPTAWERARWTT